MKDTNMNKIVTSLITAALTVMPISNVSANPLNYGYSGMLPHSQYLNDRPQDAARIKQHMAAHPRPLYGYGAPLPQTGVTTYALPQFKPETTANGGYGYNSGYGHRVIQSISRAARTIPYAAPLIAPFVYMNGGYNEPMARSRPCVVHENLYHESGQVTRVCTHR